MQTPDFTHWTLPQCGVDKGPAGTAVRTVWVSHNASCTAQYPSHQAAAAAGPNAPVRWSA